MLVYLLVDDTVARTVTTPPLLKVSKLLPSMEQGPLYLEKVIAPSESELADRGIESVIEALDGRLLKTRLGIHLLLTLTSLLSEAAA